MSLDYNLSTVPDANWQNEEGNMSEMTYCIIQTLDAVKIRAVKPDNIAKIVERQRQHDSASPPRGWKLKGIDNYLFTLDDVRPFIGLTTNVTELNDDGWCRYVRIQRIYTIFRRHNNNEVPYNSTRNGIRNFSCRNFSMHEGSKLRAELLRVGGTLAMKEDELRNPVWVYSIVNYE